jgi:hypothetical protein
VNTAAWSENRLSAVIVGFLEEICDEEQSPTWRPIRESVVDPPLAELLSGKGNPDKAKRIDILFWSFGMRCRVGFAVEAKLLSDQPLKSRSPAALTQAYVENGMARFVQGRYGRGSPTGSMLGYIVSGSAAHHATQIAEQIQTSRFPCKVEFAAAHQACCSSHYESSHPRSGRTAIVLHHLLLPC